MPKKKTKTSSKNKKIKNKEVVENNVEKKKRPRKPAQGSRFTSVLLLIVTILVSLGFYFYGVIIQGNVQIEFGQMEDSWEYSK